MKEVHVLVDLENNLPTLGDVERLVPDLTNIWLFHSKHQVKRLESFESIGNRRTKVPISRPGKNSLDFHLAFYLGYIASKHPKARLVVMAIDGGYDPLLVHARQLGFDVDKVPFKKKAKAEEVSAAKNGPAARKTAKKLSVATNAVPTKKAASAKKAPAKKAASARKVLPAAKAAPVKKPSTKKVKPPQKVALAQTSVAELGKLYAKLIEKLKTLGGNRATKLNKLRPQITSALGLKDDSSQLVDNLLDRLTLAGVVQAPETGRLRYSLD